AGDLLAVHLEHARAAAADAAHVVEGEGGRAKAVILEVELDGVLAGRKRVRAFPAGTFIVHQVPEEHRLALEQVEPIAPKPSTGGQNHALRAAFGHFDFSLDVVGTIQQQRRITLRNAGDRLRIDKFAPAGGDV